MPRNVHVSQRSKRSRYRLEKKRQRVMVELEYLSDSSDELDTNESVADKSVHGSDAESDDGMFVRVVHSSMECNIEADEYVGEEMNISDGEESLHSEYSEEEEDSPLQDNDPFPDDDPVESEESDEEMDFNISSGDEKLYDGASVTVAESFVAILQFFLSEKLANSSLSRLLQLIDSLLPKPNKSIRSLYFFRLMLANNDCDIVKHYFCDHCFKELVNETDKCTECKESNIAYFIEIPLESQLRELFARPGFYEDLSYRFNRIRGNNHDLDDIYDGEMYKKHCSGSGNFDLRSQSQISFMWNMDGVPLFKSSKIGIWPLFLKINELPPALRNKHSNLLMTGFWFGTTKPNTNLFMSPLRESMKAMADGIPIHVCDLNKVVNIKGLVLCGTADLPAQALALNMVRYNGKYGCHICKIRTERIEKRSVYSSTDPLDLRTLQQTRQYANDAAARGKSVFGVKGPTILSAIVEDYIQSTMLDPMHLLSGIAKLLLKLWIHEKLLDEENKLIIGNIKAVNTRLCSIKPPLSVERTPRSMDDYAYWKASEYITWLLIYSLPVLNGIMSTDYFSHHQKLVCSVTLLYQDCVPLQSIRVAEQLLHDYVVEFKDLYPTKYMTCQIHSLLHLCQNVRDCGPLRIFSCFPFENGNGVLKSLLHATRDSQLQICAAVSSYVRLDSIKSKNLVPGSDIAKFCENMASHGFHRRKLTPIINGISIVGSVKKVSSVTRILMETLRRSGFNGNSVYEFTRLFKRGRVIAAQSYKRVSKTDSSCVEFIDNGVRKIGRVEKFLRISNCKCKNSLCIDCSNEVETVAIIAELNYSHQFVIDQPRTVINSIYTLRQQASPRVVAVDITQIDGLLFYIVIDDTIYAAKPVTL